jgi:CBS domain-containing protein
MAARLACGRPVHVEDGGTIVGVIDEDDILRAILRR